MLDPETGLILFVVGGIGTVASFIAYKEAQTIGASLSAEDLLPALPPYPPLPRFVFTKPNVVSSIPQEM
jgi:hypothetical protein